jgi:SAM-dependent methyltransferase
MKDSFYTVSEDYYRLFEEKHRGSVQDIKNRLQVYIPFITALTKIDPSAAVADIGCGRGEWLEILRDHNIPAFGVDLDEGMLERGLQVGLDVKKMDCLEFLRSQADESLLAITGFHIAEHLPFEVLQAVVKESERVLKPGGLLILETPNPENISVGTCSFYMDPTHNHPLPPSLLEFIPNYYGFLRTKILRLQEKSTLRDLESVITLVYVLKGVSPDYGLVAQKKADQEIIQLADACFNQEYGVTLDNLGNRYDQRLAQQAKRINKTLSNQATKFHNFENQLQRFQQEFENTKHELLAVHAHNQSLQQQVIDFHNSKSWKITYPLRWVSGQAHALRTHGIRARGRQVIKRILKKSINIALGVFHNNPKIRRFVFSTIKKLGIYTLIQSVYRRVVYSAPNSQSGLIARERSVIYQENMTSRAIAIYEQLKNTNNNKHGE